MLFYIQLAQNKITILERAIKNREGARQELEDARGTEDEIAKIDNVRALIRSEFNLKQERLHLEILHKKLFFMKD